MVVGASQFWLNSLKDVDLELMKCVVRVWPEVVRRLRQTEREDIITERLVDVLRKDRGVCALGFLCLHHKLRSEDAAGDFSTKGILDMALFLCQDHERYIAYECKRLNTVSDEGARIASLAGPYVEEGVVRYVTARYSERLPYGCMIGYVMDGDMLYAFQKVRDAILQRWQLVSLQVKEIDPSIASFAAFDTSHRRKNNGSPIVIRHRLFSMIN